MGDAGTGAFYSGGRMRYTKKISVIFLALLFSALMLNASVSGVAKRGMPITAYKGEVQDVSVTAINALSHEDAEGIPFYLTDESVSYSTSPSAVTGKRQIATWSFYSNFPNPRITIDAPHLTHADGTQVPYQLAFYYQFKDGNSYLDGNLIVNSGELYDSAQDSTCLWNTSSSSVMFTNRPVRFMLGDVDIADEEYPYGDYRAVVTITIQAGDR